MKKNKGPKILFLDIETSPLEVFVWNIGDVSVSINQIIKDWSILSFSAKWLDSDKIIYRDTRDKKDPRDDKELVTELHNIMKEAQWIVAQNGKRFDSRKVKARIIYHGLAPLNEYKVFDTYTVGKKHFDFTSHKLEYMCEHLGLPIKKFKAKKFPGMELWRQCLNQNTEAWGEMEKYNRIDVLALEGLFHVLRPYGPSMDFDIYQNGDKHICPSCGSDKVKKEGLHRNKRGVFQRYSCKVCLSWSTGKTNLKKELENEN